MERSKKHEIEYHIISVRKSILEILLLGFFIFLLSPKTYSQLSNLSDQQNIIKRKCQYINADEKKWYHSVVETPLNRISAELCKSPVIVSSNDNSYCKNSLINQPILDSILGESTTGYFTELDNWYFKYDKTSKLKSSKRFFYNAQKKIENVTELRTYDEKGRVIKYVLRQPEMYAIDTSVIDYCIEDYIYENENLVQKTITNNENLSYHGAEITNYFFTYNDSEQLIHKTENLSGASYETDYYYTAVGDLEYSFQTTNSKSGYLIKYQYQFTDSTKDTKISVATPLKQTERSQFDTVSILSYVSNYYETFDYKGRRLSVECTDLISYGEPRLDFRSEYKYTESDKLRHASYYDWVKNGDSGSWREMTRIDNIYDENENLLLYEKTFNDDRTGSWNVIERKTYYYSFPQKSTTSNNIKTNQLSLFPNPAVDYIYIPCLPENVTSYQIFNLLGGIVEFGEFENSALCVTHLKPGIYIFKAESKNSGYSGRFVKY
jgi:hypothetical protein